VPGKIKNIMDKIKSVKEESGRITLDVKSSLSTQEEMVNLERKLTIIK